MENDESGESKVSAQTSKESSDEESESSGSEQCTKQSSEKISSTYAKCSTSGRNASEEIDVNVQSLEAGVQFKQETNTITDRCSRPVCANCVELQCKIERLLECNQILACDLGNCQAANNILKVNET